MAAKNPRINVVLDRNIYALIKSLSVREGVSMSLKSRDLIIEALETHEDLLLSKIAEKRESDFDRSKALKHKEVW
ncbi:MAG: antitoxin, RHH family protein [Deltaproteobacteria bacterium]|nr:antitoxin, RHH family protein [Deltaproteobacteria bacterium]